MPHSTLVGCVDNHTWCGELDVYRYGELDAVIQSKQLHKDSLESCTSHVAKDIAPAQIYNTYVYMPLDGAFLVQNPSTCGHE